jgi:tetratricopeptide (TPR) repeat protein
VKSAGSRGGGVHRVVLAGVLAVIGCGLAEPASSQATSPAYRDAYERMLAAPTDVDAAFAFAEAAVAAGDLYGAIAALERILRLDPDRPDVEIRLGELYAMVGATRLAQAYLEQGLTSPAVPPAVRERAEALLAEAGRAEAEQGRRQRISGILSFGARYETNANAGPDTTLVRAGGQDAFLAPDDLEQDDVSVALTADLRHRWRLDDQAGHVLESNLVGFVSRYGSISTSNTTLLDLDVGPRMFVGETGRVSLRPFAEAGFLALADEPYRTQVGGGLNARWIARPDLLLEATGRWVSQDYRDTADQPVGSLRSGSEATLRPGVTYELGPRTLVSGDVLVGRKEADADFESFIDLGLGFSVTHVLAADVVRDWSLTANAFWRRSRYDEPDPFVDPDVTREDDRFDVGVTLSIPLGELLSLSFGARHTVNDSNLPNFEFDNTTVSALTSIAF